MLHFDAILRFGVLKAVGFWKRLSPLSRKFLSSLVRKWYFLVHFSSTMRVTAGRMLSSQICLVF